MRGSLQCELPNANLHVFKGRFDLHLPGMRSCLSLRHTCKLELQDPIALKKSHVSSLIRFQAWSPASNISLHRTIALLTC